MYEVTVSVDRVWFREVSLHQAHNVWHLELRRVRYVDNLAIIRGCVCSRRRVSTIIYHCIVGGHFPNHVTADYTVHLIIIIHRIGTW